MPLRSSCVASSMAMMLSGYLLLANFFKTWALSVSAPKVTLASPLAHEAPGENIRTAASTPTSSKLAMARKGSPFRYARGADLRSSRKKKPSCFARLCLLASLPAANDYLFSNRFRIYSEDVLRIGGQRLQRSCRLANDLLLHVFQ